ncbi:MAG: glutamate--cysteine ligase [SAR324 cluster bacterium]|nr:glutamate--cysteine ligase [SAR324 cluster bacterium]
MTTTIFSGKSEPIESAQDLLTIFKSSEKPPQQWRVGTEHEKLGFYRDTLQPVPYAGERGISALLAGFVEKFGWEPVAEGEQIIALLRNDAAITLEPGGQFELSGAPMFTAHDTCQELHQHLQELRDLSEPLGITWLASGRNPLIASSEMPWMPKERYEIMRRYLPTRGGHALDMMTGTGTVQTNLDYSSEADMARKLYVAFAIAPFLTALFANSPFAEGKPSGYLSTRGKVWLDVDGDRSGIIPAVFREDFGYQDYVDYALDVPMFFIHRDGHYRDYAGHSFRNFMADGLDGYTATLDDWTLHLTTIFPEARLKNIIELRMADMGPTAMICAFAAVSRGLLYDETALDSAVALLRKVKLEDYPQLQEDTARIGLRAEVAGRPVREWLRDLISIAASGLERLNAQDEQGENEGKFLEPLRRIVDTGKTQADLLLDRWNGEWNQSMEPLFSSEFVL